MLAWVLGATAHAQPGPDGDSDGDGVVDRLDRCPTLAGLLVDGCPPRDTDGDGAEDRADRCPEDPGPPANQGCPDQDSDDDGVADRLDRCPVVMGPEDLGGCPPADADDDGVPDATDRCPAAAEVWNGRRDTDGCPDKGQALVAVAEGRITFAHPVRVDSRGRIRVTDRAMIEAAGAVVRAARAQRVTLVVVSDYGLSYGDSLQRSRALAALVRGELAAAASLPVEHVRARGAGPDGTPRVELSYR